VLSVLRLHELKLSLDHTEQALRAAVLARLEIADADLLTLKIHRRGNDARKRSNILLVYTVDVEVRDEAAALKRFAHDPQIAPTPDMTYKVVRQTKGLTPRPVVIGFGPCGLFAGLILAEMGLRPLILERGKPVRERTKDTFGFWRKGILNPSSNAQFGEGGAGTFSDGKLYSQIKDPEYRGRRVLTEFVEAGAPPEILTAAKPHIGTFRLVPMIENMRAKIERLGGEIRFEALVEDILVEGGAIAGLKLHGGEEIACTQVAMAIGHSARDTFEMLHIRGVFFEAKSFSIGARIEHPQGLIDRCRYGAHAGHPDLGAADYSLAHRAANGRGAYSFCMCPGGTVVAAASELGGVVTNGMSQYSRRERNANAAIVVEVTPTDYPQGPLAGIAFQRHWEERAFAAGGGDYHAPGQLVGDFLKSQASREFGGVNPSYKPGVRLGDLSECLPEFAVSAMREALLAFDARIKGFSMVDAVLTGVETRTSSPVRMTRGPDFQSLHLRGLYPAGEGAGYAGGILSAAVDGIRVAEAVGRGLTDEPAQRR
jgi:uncharacterized FAD-dependent dehydrogenase